MTVGVALNASKAETQVDTAVQLADEAAASGLRSAWFGQTFGADSPQLAAIAGREVPGTEGGVPLLVAAMRPQALPAADELADGILPCLAGPRALSEHIVPALTAAAKAAGRPAPRIVAIGDEKTVAAEVRRYRDAGATEVVFSGTETAGEADRRRTWTLLGELAG
ncbi:LLM class oxidoreductase [Streptomyces olivochromogenes]|uniref:hypothetical protein n=1 Tax=Streptomyces olivochromogenes TaxID=1963 RepID=UPI00369ABA7C